MFGRIYLPMRRFPGIAEVSDSRLVVETAPCIAKQWGVRAIETVEETSISRAGAEEAEHLEVALWNPCLLVTRTLYELGNEQGAFVHSRTWIAGGIATSVRRPPGDQMCGKRSRIGEIDENRGSSP